MSYTTVEAATVICLRHRIGGSPGAVLELGELALPSAWWSRLPDRIPFEAGWEVLMGQSECTNWLRSTRHKEAIMRYAGEFKFAGGTADPEDGDSLEATAKRELREEYELAHVPAAAIRLHPFNVKQTKPIQGRSYVMHNFVALASENPWLADAGLTHRRRILPTPDVHIIFHWQTRLPHHATCSYIYSAYLGRSACAYP